MYDKLYNQLTWQSSKNSILSYRIPVFSLSIGKCVADLFADRGGCRPIWLTSTPFQSLPTTKSQTVVPGTTSSSFNAAGNWYLYECQCRSNNARGILSSYAHSQYLTYLDQSFLLKVYRPNLQNRLSYDHIAHYDALAMPLRNPCAKKYELNKKIWVNIKQKLRVDYKMQKTGVNTSICTISTYIVPTWHPQHLPHTPDRPWQHWIHQVFSIVYTFLDPRSKRQDQRRTVQDSIEVWSWLDAWERTCSYV